MEKENWLEAYAMKIKPSIWFSVSACLFIVGVCLFFSFIAEFRQKPRIYTFATGLGDEWVISKDKKADLGKAVDKPVAFAFVESEMLKLINFRSVNNEIGWFKMRTKAINLKITPKELYKTAYEVDKRSIKYWLTLDWDQWDKILISKYPFLFLFLFSFLLFMIGFSLKSEQNNRQGA